MAASRHRLLSLERLQNRLLMAADAGKVTAMENNQYELIDDAVQITGNWHAYDVDQNDIVDGRDAELIIGSLGSDQLTDSALFKMDVNRDGFVSPLDALLVINELEHASDHTTATTEHAVNSADGSLMSTTDNVDDCGLAQTILGNLSNEAHRGDADVLGQLDVNNDDALSPLDALLVINDIENGCDDRRAPHLRRAADDVTYDTLVKSSATVTSERFHESVVDRVVDELSFVKQR